MEQQGDLCVVVFVDNDGDERFLMERRLSRRGEPWSDKTIVIAEDPLDFQDKLLKNLEAFKNNKISGSLSIITDISMSNEGFIGIIKGLKNILKTFKYTINSTFLAVQSLWINDTELADERISPSALNDLKALRPIYISDLEELSSLEEEHENSARGFRKAVKKIIDELSRKNLIFKISKTANQSNLVDNFLRATVPGSTKSLS